MNKELAVSLYARDILSFGQARRVAGVSKRTFHELLGEHELPRHYTDPELTEDLEYAKSGDNSTDDRS